VRQFLWKPVFTFLAFPPWSHPLKIKRNPSFRRARLVWKVSSALLVSAAKKPWNANVKVLNATITAEVNTRRVNSWRAAGNRTPFWQDLVNMLTGSWNLLSLLFYTLFLAISYPCFLPLALLSYLYLPPSPPPSCQGRMTKHFLPLIPLPHSPRFSNLCFWDLK